jgi:hypothetical protein
MQNAKNVASTGESTAGNGQLYGGYHLAEIEKYAYSHTKQIEALSGGALHCMAAEQ